MSTARLKHYGWGREGEGMTPQEREFVLGLYKTRFGVRDFEGLAVPRLEDLDLREPRIQPPASLAAICSTEHYDRAAHTYGKSYPDYVRAMLGDYACAPDVVAYPRSEAEISAETFAPRPSLTRASSRQAGFPEEPGPGSLARS